jgi:hypothetical protein
VDDFRAYDTVYSITPRNLAGLNLGIISNLHLGNNFDVRLIPTLSFVQRNLDYEIDLIDSISLLRTEVKTIESTYLEFPLHLKFKSNRINNYRVFVFGGVKFASDMISQAKVQQRGRDIVKLKRQDFGYEIGMGFDFYMVYFKFSPEIKMYNGMNNLIVKENTTYARPLKNLQSKAFVVSFTFE